MVIHLPQLALEVFHPRWSDELTIVVLEQQRVMALSRLAWLAGIRTGMRLSGVQMLHHDTVIKQRDVHKEMQALHAVAMSCLQFSPQVSVLDPANVLINIGASLRLFGGVRRLRRLIVRTVHQLGLSAQWGLSVTSGAAYLFAQSSQRYRSRSALQLAKLHRHLDALPLHLLPTATAWTEWLHSIGCHDLGALRRLPRAGLQRRCGIDLLHSLDVAYGERITPAVWFTAPAQFSVRMDLPDRIERGDVIFYFARTLLLQLCGWLTQQQLAIVCFELRLEHERGRQAIAPTHIEIRLSHPSWHEEHLTRLIKERLAQTQLPAAAIGLRLHACELCPLSAPNNDLFPEPGGTQEEQSNLLELLVARLGKDNVLRPAPMADHRPEIANQWCSVLHAKSRQHTMSLAIHTTSSVQTIYRPSWLLPQPLLLEVRQHRPYYRSPLRLVSPAERIEAGWWQDHVVTRDYFIAESNDHLRYWIFRERLPHAGQAESEDAQWYLHGVFG